uniref:Uncharacterized protein n=1 Tax=Anguilla anguilla TaxID=7936 RepID=A0A0E9PWL4_ANGAN
MRSQLYCCYTTDCVLYFMPFDRMKTKDPLLGLVILCTSQQQNTTLYNSVGRCVLCLLGFPLSDVTFC